MTKLTIYGQPITKKNSQRPFAICPKGCPGQWANVLLRRQGQKPMRPKINMLQSEAYEKYEAEACRQIALLWPRDPINGPITVKCIYYLQTVRVPDLLNLEASTHDILEKAGVIVNDSQVKSTDGSRIIGKDPDPRVEIEIVEMV